MGHRTALSWVARLSLRFWPLSPVHSIQWDERFLKESPACIYAFVSLYIPSAPVLVKALRPESGGGPLYPFLYPACLKRGPKQSKRVPRTGFSGSRSHCSPATSTWGQFPSQISSQ